MLKAKKGRLLISEPSLDNNFFFKSIILLTHHNNEESIGLIINRPTKVKLNEIINNIPLGDFPIYVGGPVEKKSLHFIHTLGSIIPNSTQIIDNIYFGGDFDFIIKLIQGNKISKDQIRFFIGYTGWGPEQLNNEIREEAWIVENHKDTICMHYSTSKLWSDMIKTQNIKYAIWSNMPKSPDLN